MCVVVVSYQEYSLTHLTLAGEAALGRYQHLCIARLAGGGRGKDEPLSVIAMELQAAPGDDDLPPPGPPRHASAA